jgi:hypothetical protein
MLKTARHLNHIFDISELLTVNIVTTFHAPASYCISLPAAANFKITLSLFTGYAKSTIRLLLL